MQVQITRRSSESSQVFWRGRKLPVLNAEGLASSGGDCVKETSFNWLMPLTLWDSHCLDNLRLCGHLACGSSQTS